MATVQAPPAYDDLALSVQVSAPDDASIMVVVRGDVDTVGALPLRRALADVWAEEPARVVVDLVDVTFLNAAGLRVLLEAAATADARAAVLDLRPSPGHQTRLLEWVGLLRPAVSGHAATVGPCSTVRGVPVGPVRRAAPIASPGGAPGPRRVRALVAVPDLVPGAAPAEPVHPGPADGSETALLGWARLWQAAPDLEALLQSITSEAVRGLPGTEEAGISLVTGSGRSQFRGRPGSTVDAVHQVQQTLRRAPAVDTAGTVRPTVLQDVLAEPCSAVMAEAMHALDVRSLLNLRLHVPGRELGTLTVHSSRPGAFDDDRTLDAAQAFATIAGVALAGALELHRLRLALHNRDVVGQATGMLMERHGVTASQALDSLVEVCQDWDTTLAALAHEVTAPADGDGRSTSELADTAARYSDTARSGATRSGGADARPPDDRRVPPTRQELHEANERLERLERAVASGHRIGMAMGIVMQRQRLSEADAFELLREESRRRDVRLRTIAEETIYRSALTSSR